MIRDPVQSNASAAIPPAPMADSSHTSLHEPREWTRTVGGWLKLPSATRQPDASTTLIITSKAAMLYVGGFSGG